jgi:Arc/MetJ family transcription regulator
MTQRVRETEPSDSRRATALARMEQLILSLPGKSDTVNGLMREHLETARFYLLGSMPEEYEFNLRLAQELLRNIEDDTVKARIADFLQASR